MRTSGVGFRWAFVLIPLLLLMVGVAVAPVAAQVRLVTDFPGLALSSGETRSISLTLVNDGDRPETVDLSIVQAPDDWKVTLKGRGMVVHRAYVGPQEDGRPGRTSLNLEVQVPTRVEPGDYPITILAGNQRLEMSVRIIEGTAAGEVELTSQYPRLRGPAGAEFGFPITLANRSGEDETFQFQIDAPRGWQVSVSPRFENRQVASIGVSAGSTERLEVKVVPPRQVEAGEYPIRLRAVAPGMSAEIQLVTEITGTYQMELGTPTGRLNADVPGGGEGTVKLVVLNTGTSDLENITFSSTAPPNWRVTFDPERIDRVPAGETREVTATIRPADRAIAGDYVVTVRANSPEATASASLRTTVHTPTTWGWVGVGVVAAVLAGLLGTFRVYGRR